MYIPSATITVTSAWDAKILIAVNRYEESLKHLSVHMTPFGKARGV